MSNYKIHIIINPASAGGKTGESKEKILSELKKQIGSNFEFSETRAPYDATTITRKAITNGCQVVIAVGGDGTVNEVANGFFVNGKIINPDVKFGVISFGTGQGFAQSIGLPADLSTQIQIIKNDKAKLIDVGEIHFENNNLSKYFVNEFQLGIGGTLNKNISKLTKKVLGKFAFGFEAVKTLMYYQANDLQMVINGEVHTEKIIGVVISNGEFTGGGMRLTPFALTNDGLLDVLLIKEMSSLDRYISFSKVYSAEHINLEAFQLFRTKKIEFRYNNGLAVSADGEMITDKCISAEVIPSALKVISNNYGD